jgi:hypothetical protein
MLPDERHEQAPEIATSTDPRTGLPVVNVGTFVSSEDVRSLDDDE